jgi:DNA repair protein RadD
MASIKLWAHQEQTITAAYAARDRGVERVLIVLPTGAGKSVIAARITADAYREGKSVLIRAHRCEILNQLAEHVERAGVPRKDIGIMRADDKRTNPSARVQIASVATLIRRDMFKADVVITDEAHRGASDSYVESDARHEGAWRVGLTATPHRLDGKPLGDVYDEIVAVATYSDLIKAGKLVAPKVYSVPPDRLPNLKGMGRLVGGDFNPTELGKRVNKRELVGDIVSEWKKHGRGLRTVCFAANLAHAASIAKRFAAGGVRVAVLSGETPETERAEILARLGSMALEVVVNCAILGEGWDMPSCKCVILARPTKSITVYNQQAGRIFRPWEGVTPIVLDHAGNVYRFGFPDMDRAYSLTEKVTCAASEKSPPCKHCPACDRVVAIGVGVCPECGHKWEAKVLEERPEIALVEAEREAVERHRAEVLVRATSVAGRINASRAWIDCVVEAQLGAA